MAQNNKFDDEWNQKRSSSLHMIYTGISKLYARNVKGAKLVRGRGGLNSKISYSNMNAKKPCWSSIRHCWAQLMNSLCWLESSFLTRILSKIDSLHKRGAYQYAFHIWGCLRKWMGCSKDLHGTIFEYDSAISPEHLIVCIESCAWVDRSMLPAAK